MRRILIALGGIAVLLGLSSTTAAACGGLVAPNGAIRLQRATTLVDWHDGVERYFTSFSFQGDVSDVGWIVPLPAVPTRVEEGGGWTLQRLEREVHPQRLALSAVAADAAAPAAEVLQQVKVRALDVTVIRGSAPAVIEWCTRNGFVLPAETRDHIARYAAASPIFMAARYDVSAARRQGLSGGDGTPLLITMPTPHLWVPLEVLANDDSPVGADLFLLTDEAPRTGLEPVFGGSPVGTELPGAPGFTVRHQSRLDPALYRDLSSDRNMGWVRPGSWLTYLTLDAPSDSVDYDLGVTSANEIRLASFATSPAQVGSPSPPEPRFTARTPMDAPGIAAIAASGGLGIVILAVLWRRARERDR